MLHFELYLFYCYSIEFRFIKYVNHAYYLKNSQLVLHIVFFISVKLFFTLLKMESIPLKYFKNGKLSNKYKIIIGNIMIRKYLNRHAIFY